MSRKRKWTSEQLVEAVISSSSYRQVIHKLGLIPAGGNYRQLKHYITEGDLDTSHFTGRVWNKGLSWSRRPDIPLEQLLTKGSTVQSYKLKLRLFLADLKNERCEECGWAEQAVDGRIPLELDHINGVSNDNRLVNLRILCPNCHSLKPTHRGRNKGKHARVV